MHAHTYAYIIYDSIDNSVFESQVLTPFLAHPDSPDSSAQKILITFEKSALCPKRLLSIAHTYPTLTLIVLKKLPLMGTLSLYYAYFKLKKILSTYKPSHILARGPLAGWITLKAINSSTPVSLTIQARSILTEEYAYTYVCDSSMWHRWRLNTLKYIEQSVYSPEIVKQFPFVRIEAVSPALEDYMRATWKTPEHAITIAYRDIPNKIAPEIIKSWRLHVRQELAIPDDYFVYCYNGSVKPWQCPELVINFFKEALITDKNSFLLVITQDTYIFKQRLASAQVPLHSYLIVRVTHDTIYRYLAAADMGMLIREPHIINWTSRPTKMLEYQAVGLPIAHNNTIAWLAEKNDKLMRNCQRELQI
jgi:hypothetical protein